MSKQPFDNASFLYQVKWDGVRMLAVIEGKKVSLLNKRGNLRTDQYPELQKLSEIINNGNAILDGEIVVLCGGKPSFPSVMRRDNCRDPMKIRFLSHTQTISYMVFDLIYLDGIDLRSWSLMDRLSKLGELTKEQECLHLVDSFSEGTVLYNTVHKAGLEGIVAKRRDSLYYPGKKHKDWFKTKCLRQQNCLVGGYTLQGQRVNSLLLGVRLQGGLSFVGKVGTGLDAEQWQMLSDTLPRLEVDKSPFSGRTPAGSHYITPNIGVQVEYLEWTESLRLRFPVIKAFIKDSASDDFSI